MKSIKLSTYKFELSVLNQNYYRLVPIKQDIGQLLPLFAHQIQHADLQGVTNVSATDAEILIDCSEPLSTHKTYFSKLSNEISMIVSSQEIGFLSCFFSKSFLGHRFSGLGV